MRLLRHYLYPSVPGSDWLPMLRHALLGALIAGSYGVLHDQFTYSLSTEYFTRMKFHQFAWARPPVGERLFVGVIGFLATWWVGFIAGWFQSRLALPRLGRDEALKRILAGHATILAGAALGGLTGWFAGHLEAAGSPESWIDYALEYDLEGAPLGGFIQVARIHLGGYLGALAGLVIALVLLRRAPAKQP